MAELYLGVDGGNTKTIALLATAQGAIVGVGRAGCSDIFNAPSRTAALSELSAAVTAAIRSAGTQSGDVANAMLSLAGVDWPEDAALVEADFVARNHARRVVVANDALGGLRAGTPDGVGMVLACGTGGVVAARNARGDFWHSGFWAEALGGSELGRQAISAVMRAALGIDPPTALAGPVVRHFGVADAEAMVKRLNRHNVAPLTNVELSRLAPLVMDAAAANDAAALEIVSRQGRAMAAYAEVAAGAVGVDRAEAPAVLTGGVFRHASDVLVGSLARHMQRSADSFLRPRREPAVGALLLAFETAGLVVTEPMLASVDGTAPDDEFYRTAG